MLYTKLFQNLITYQRTHWSLLQSRSNLNRVGAIWQNHVIFYPTPSALSYLWGFGSLALIFLVIQLITGIILVMHFQPDPLQAFDAVNRITNTVPYGWLFRYLHANGASFFLLIVYIHMGRGLYYGSLLTPRVWIWITGMIIFLLMMGTAFIGYVLPWGQMSLWGATVITNLLSALPYGDLLAIWIWGGFSVGGVTLNRFFSLHYLLPFLVLAVVFAHLYVLHDVGSNNPQGLESHLDALKAAFAQYFTLKDVFGLFLMLIIYFMFVFFYPNYLGHPDNYVKANPMVTPPHIVPEWYFLPFYAILRSIPHKLGGVLFMGGALVMPVLYSMSITLSKVVNESQLRRCVADLQITKALYWLFIFNFLLLGLIGGKPVETPYYEIGQMSTAFFFLWWFLLPVSLVMEISLKRSSVSSITKPDLSPLNSFTYFIVVSLMYFLFMTMEVTNFMHLTVILLSKPKGLLNKIPHKRDFGLGGLEYVLPGALGGAVVVYGCSRLWFGKASDHGLDFTKSLAQINKRRLKVQTDLQSKYPDQVVDSLPENDRTDIIQFCFDRENRAVETVFEKIADSVDCDYPGSLPKEFMEELLIKDPLQGYIAGEYPFICDPCIQKHLEIMNQELICKYEQGAFITSVHNGLWVFILTVTIGAIAVTIYEDSASDGDVDSF